MPYVNPFTDREYAIAAGEYRADDDGLPAITVTKAPGGRWPHNVFSYNKMTKEINWVNSVVFSTYWKVIAKCDELVYGHEILVIAPNASYIKQTRYKEWVDPNNQYTWNTIYFVLTEDLVWDKDWHIGIRNNTKFIDHEERRKQLGLR